MKKKFYESVWIEINELLKLDVIMESGDAIDTFYDYDDENPWW